MRTIYDTDGNDVTTTVQTALRAGRSFRMANLYTFAQRNFWNGDSFGSVGIWRFTDADVPLYIPMLQFFNSGAISLNSFANTSLGAFTVAANVPNADFGTGYGSFGAITTNPCSSILYRIESRTLAGYYAPGNGVFSDNNMYAAPGFDNPLAPARANINKVYVEYDIVQTLTSGGNDTFWSMEASINGGASWFSIDGNVNTFTPTHFKDDITSHITGYSTTFDYTQLQVRTGLASSLFWGPDAVPATNTFSNIRLTFGYIGGGGVTSLAADTYYPENIKRGKLSYKVGLESSEVDVDWYLDDTKDYFAPVATYSMLTNPPVVMLPMKEAMSRYRAFDDCPFWIHHVLIPDGPLTGSSVLYTNLAYRGFIRKTEVSDDYLKITVGSLMQILQDTQVPGQLIMPGNRDIQFLSSQGFNSALLTGPMVVHSPVSISFIAAANLTLNQLQDCWITFQPSTPNFWAGQNGLPPTSVPGWRIRQHNAVSAGASVNIFFYDPPIIPGTPAGYNIFTQTTGASSGFPYIPPPENSL